MIINVNLDSARRYKIFDTLALSIGSLKYSYSYTQGNSITFSLDEVQDNMRTFRGAYSAIDIVEVIGLEKLYMLINEYVSGNSTSFGRVKPSKIVDGVIGAIDTSVPNNDVGMWITMYYDLVEVNL